MQELSGALPVFESDPLLAIVDSQVHDGFSSESFVLSGPGATAQAGHLPVRGDLAHIKMAGRYFVPHYAVPMPRIVANNDTALQKAGNGASNGEAEVVAVLAAGTVFNVLDISGGWAWGQVGEDGFVGYLPLTALEERSQ